MRPIVALLGSLYDPAVEALLEEHADVRRADPDESAAVAEALIDAHGVIVRYPTKITAKLIADAPNLLAILSSGRGSDHIDIPSATAAGVIVANNPGLGAQPVSEHTLGLLIMITRDLGEVTRYGIEGAWNRRLTTHRVELGGNVLGIVGCGSIGSAVARRASAGFGMRVLAYDPYVPAGRLADVGATKVHDLAELLRQSDFITAHPELNDETEGMFDDKAFALMKSGAYFVNTSRGKVVKTNALVHALSSGHLAGAALDVYEEEPLPADSPLFEMDNVVLTAHVAALTVQTKRALSLSAVTKLLGALRGEQPPSALNPEVWPLVRLRSSAMSASG
jgi:phosphoglycerate dehydrogenase-like enzyme